MDFHGTVCVVTGGASGIGCCITREFAKKGAKIAFIDRDEQAGRENLAYLLEEGAEALFFHGDIGKESVLNAFADKVAHTYGKVDFLINNACTSHKGLLSSCSYEDFNEILRIGVTAPYYLTKLLLPYFTPPVEGTQGGAMTEVPTACIVNIASTRAFMSQPDTESYSAAKGGISALTHAMAASLSGKARVNAISPGWIDVSAYHGHDTPHFTNVDTLQHPSGRIGTPEDIAQAVLFLCSSENSFLNGQNISIDGGMTKLMVYTDDCNWEYQSC